MLQALADELVTLENGFGNAAAALIAFPVELGEPVFGGFELFVQGSFAGFHLGLEVDVLLVQLIEAVILVAQFIAHGEQFVLAGLGHFFQIVDFTGDSGKILFVARVHKLALALLEALAVFFPLAGDTAFRFLEVADLVVDAVALDLSLCQFVLQVPEFIRGFFKDLLHFVNLIVSILGHGFLP